MKRKKLIFKRHSIRNFLLKLWVVVKNKFYGRTPTLITTVEAFRLQNLINWKQTKTYKEFLKPDETLKWIQDLEEININMAWWERAQLISQYIKDKKEKCYIKPIPLDEIFTGPAKKMIRKFYNILLEIEAEQEIIKPTMLKGMQDFKETISMD